MRVKALEAVGGFREDLIAGEEPELCVRLRAKGWRIWRLDSDMALHDAAMNRFAQWWQRNMRSGYSFAQGAYLHGALPERHFVWESLRPWFWGICLPLACLLAGLMFGFWGWAVLADLSIACSAKGGSQPRPLAAIVRCWQRSMCWDTSPRAGARSSSCAIVCSGARRALSNTSNITMRVAYLVNQYPAVSHSFIRREILALERQGVEIVRVALQGWDGELVGGEDQLERERTRYVRREGAPALLLALARMLFTRPTRLLRALALAWQMGRRAERPLPMHFVYLAEACRLEPWLRAARIQHLHVHFANNSAEIAMLVRVLGGPQWSFTVHGRDIDNAPFTRLAAKIRDSVFVVAISSYGRSQLYRWVEPQHWNKVKVVHCGLEPAFHASARTSDAAMRRGDSFAWAG